jgi:hypothetical protein
MDGYGVRLRLSESVTQRGAELMMASATPIRRDAVQAFQVFESRV